MERALRISIEVEAIVFGSLLCLLQALDAYLTSLGVSRFGIEVEANPLIRHMMFSFGELPALAIVKCLAFVAIISLVFLSQKLNWITRAMGVVAALYLFVAIIPWTYILFVRDYL